MYFCAAAAHLTALDIPRPGPASDDDDPAVAHRPTQPSSANGRGGEPLEVRAGGGTGTGSELLGATTASGIPGVEAGEAPTRELLWAGQAAKEGARYGIPGTRDAGRASGAEEAPGAGRAGKSAGLRDATVSFGRARREGSLVEGKHADPEHQYTLGEVVWERDFYHVALCFVLTAVSGLFITGESLVTRRDRSTGVRGQGRAGRGGGKGGRRERPVVHPRPVNRWQRLGCTDAMPRQQGRAAGRSPAISVILEVGCALGGARGREGLGDMAAVAACFAHGRRLHARRGSGVRSSLGAREVPRSAIRRRAGAPPLDANQPFAVLSSFGGLWCLLGPTRSARALDLR